MTKDREKGRPYRKDNLQLIQERQKGPKLSRKPIQDIKGLG